MTEATRAQIADELERAHQLLSDEGIGRMVSIKLPAILAALRASPDEADVSPRVTLTMAQAKRLVEWFGDDNDEDTEITVAHFPAGKIENDPDDPGDDKGPSPAGMYCWFADYPEEGCLPLFDAALAAKSGGGE